MYPFVKTKLKEIVIFQNVNKTFGEKKILQNINLELETGKFYCLLGPVGAGKTTLLKVIAGLEEIDPGGHMNFKNQEFSQMSLWERNAAMVYQNFVLYPHFNVFENIASPLRARKLAKNEIKSKVQSIAEMLRIDKLLSKRPRELSGGEMQRVAIARALAKEADIYLFDEILVNLDYKIREEMRPELRKITQGQGRMVIFSTSDPVDVLSMGDKVIIMDQGEILQFGNVGEVYEYPKNIRAGKYFGYPEMNILEAMITDNNNQIQLEIGTQKQTLKVSIHLMQFI
ncbi:MAG: ABC transporter ATP-binding protein [Candidatus Atribacteria bacterium]|nr:ABC transporter ATP-binding protein [Candidatus Atribacteria bacterium]